MQPPFPPPLLTDDVIQPVIRAALAEDIGAGDLTGAAIIPAHQHARFSIVTREPLIVAGLGIAEATFREVLPDVQWQPQTTDGTAVAAETTLAEVAGQARGLLAAERTALNFLQLLSAIATTTRRYVDAIAHTQARLLDTRKTIPGLRVFSKYATHVGGAWNHRWRLDDALMLKDNHIALCGTEGGLAAAVRQALAFAGERPVIVECDTLQQAEVALEAGARWLLLDNMRPADLRVGVQLAQGRAVIEASGGVRLETIAAIAETGVTYISCGRITSAPGSVDIGLDWG
jgi:nicotinate-nucleotide pyrophosphorylase (carboxylating)